MIRDRLYRPFGKLTIKCIFALCLLAISQTANAGSDTTQPLPASYFSWTQTELPLRTKLRTRYKGVQIRLISHYPSALTLLENSRLVNGMSGTDAASSYLENSRTYTVIKALRRMAGIGIFATIIRNHMRAGAIKMEQEGKPFTGKIPVTEIQPESAIVFKALVPLDKKPALDLNLEDPAAGEQYTVHLPES